LKGNFKRFDTLLNRGSGILQMAGRPVQHAILISARLPIVSKQKQYG
jgi:hypothetical protein